MHKSEGDFSEKGMKLTREYGVPNCAPGRAALLSRQYSPRTGVYAVNSGNRGESRYRKLEALPNRTMLLSDIADLG